VCRIYDRKDKTGRLPIQNYRRGGETFVNISSVTSESIGGTKIWLLVEDEQSSMKFSLLLKKRASESKIHSIVQGIKNEKLEVEIDRTMRTKII